MARQQPIVARDFMGLGMMRNSNEKDEAEGRHSSLPDSNPSTFIVSEDCGLPLKADMSGLVGPSAASMNNGSFLHGMACAGLKHSILNKPAAFQHALPPKGVQDEKLVEQIAENVPERSYSHIPRPVQSWWHGDPSIKCSPGPCDDFGLLKLGSFKGALSKNLLPFSMSNPSIQLASFSDAGHKWMSIAETTEKQESAPLTIFYGGNVNVFNDVTAEKAQAIMFLAGGSTMQRSVIDFLGSTHLPNANASDLTDKIHGDNRACCDIENGHAATNQAGHGNASMKLNFEHPIVQVPGSPDQPSVPKALPQARKASLTRFLERRRERVQSKAPYFLKQLDSSSPEERFSSSNDMASLRPSSSRDEKKRVTMSGWMEKMTESTHDLKEGTNIGFM